MYCLIVLPFFLQYLTNAKDLIHSWAIQVRRFLNIFVISLFFTVRFVSPTHNPWAGWPPLVSCLRLLIQYICSFLPSTTWGCAMLWWQGTHLTWMSSTIYMKRFMQHRESPFTVMCKLGFVVDWYDWKLELLNNFWWETPILNFNKVSEMVYEHKESPFMVYANYSSLQ
jgi:hypothetical protein